MMGAFGLRKNSRRWILHPAAVMLAGISSLYSLSQNTVSGNPPRHTTTPLQPHAPTKPGTTVVPPAIPKNPAPQTGQHGDENDGTKIPSLVKVTIVSSRGTVSRDASYGVYADFENISQSPIMLRASETVLVVQPEVAHPVACVDWAPAIFPTQSPSTAPPESTGNAAITILPNEHYEVFWDLGQRTPQKNGLCPWEKNVTWYYLGFVPGDYAFTVDGIAHLQPVDGSVATDHTFTETTTLKVGLSSLVTAVAAFFGGILAYLVIFLLPGQDFERWANAKGSLGKLAAVGVWLRNAMSAGLLSASVTIVASRLSDTQFPVKVSVNDLWGALTIGFVAYFAGKKFISGLATRWVTSNATNTQTPDSPTTPPAARQPIAGSVAPLQAIASGVEEEPPAPASAPAPAG